jgi:hypothetical protein
LVAQNVLADSFGGVGIGYSEACRTKYQPSFAGGDCIEPNVALHGLIGREVNKYFSVESSVDVSFDGGHITNAILNAILSDSTNDAISIDDTLETNRWSVVTFGVAAFAHIPLSNSLRLFAGPTLGGSMVDIDYDVKYFGNHNFSEHSATEFGLNYGYAAGAEFYLSQRSVMRMQWQNWRSLDANVAVNGVFNSNTLTFNYITYF